MRRYWFKAKNFGWGWYPVTWEGWTVLAIYLFLLWLIVDQTKIAGQKGFFVIPYVASISAITLVLLYICFRTGEKPEWRWGLTKKNKQKRSR